MCPQILKMCPQMCPQKGPDSPALPRTLSDDEQRVFRGKKKKAARFWNCAALSVVPGAGIEPARLAAGDFESPASTNFTTRAVFVKTRIMAQYAHEISDY